MSKALSLDLRVRVLEAAAGPEPPCCRGALWCVRDCRDVNVSDLHRCLYGRLPERKDGFRCDEQADCSFVSGLLMRGLLPAGPDGICRSARHLLRGLCAHITMQAWRIAV